MDVLSAWGEKDDVLFVGCTCVCVFFGTGVWRKVVKTTCWKWGNALEMRVSFQNSINYCLQYVDATLRIFYYG